jgi:hypothetical protein
MPTDIKTHALTTANLAAHMNYLIPELLLLHTAKIAPQRKGLYLYSDVLN